MKNRVEIVDVAPRDGLQNEKAPFSTEQKLELINGLIDAGIRRMEVASFVHPKRVPQMADAEDVIAGLPDRADVTYIGLTLNMRGYQRAIATRDGGRRGLDEVGCVIVASETFSQKNQGQTIEEGISVASEIISAAHSDGLRGQATISAACGCPFEGEVDPRLVIDIAKQVADLNPHEIAIADTIGVGTPKQVFELFSALRRALPDMPLRGHFHNTRNTGIANAWAAYMAGARILDSSVGGLGGCPFAPAATGNIGTEDLLYMLERSGIETGVSLEKIIDVSKSLEPILGRPTPAMVSKAGGFPAPAQETTCVA
ncbi:hydroxymethylglutaryl-CoA lyase [Emcibacter nanhaiensis]|uniref:Hydroxymethylglutaryl-CoA lyase n=1 Tax=Emcibacter nanhaiensis TaxID=1505037 RepID=A0A501PSJ5_9PROT|nr:hydroxymethylglutaryl-CoA lyase [Emcibacter nanhaiensis]TPD63225.1 hydroxymethylglutaryl-CoA lyase [Emcibacter nanhaiensis]